MSSLKPILDRSKAINEDGSKSLYSGQNSTSARVPMSERRIQPNMDTSEECAFSRSSQNSSLARVQMSEPRIQLNMDVSKKGDFNRSGQNSAFARVQISERRIKPNMDGSGKGAFNSSGQNSALTSTSRYEQQIDANMDAREKSVMKSNNMLMRNMEGPKKLEREASEDINKSAEDFIQKFRQELFLQRLESIENYEQMLKRGM